MNKILILVLAVLCVGCRKPDPSLFTVSATYEEPATKDHQTMLIVEGYTAAIRYRLNCEEELADNICFYPLVGHTYHLTDMHDDDHPGSVLNKFLGFKEMKDNNQTFLIEKATLR